MFWTKAHWPNSVLPFACVNFSIHHHHAEGIGSKAEPFLFSLSNDWTGRSTQPAENVGGFLSGKPGEIPLPMTV